jgi:hypothetical protein
VRLEHAASAGLHARITVTAVDGEWFAASRSDTALMLAPPAGAVRGRCEGDNVTCTNGLTAFAAALVWSGIQDQAANLGVTSATYLTPLYGAVGSGPGTPAASDTALFSELGRETVGAGAFSPATPSISALCTWLFYFPSPAGTWTVTEAGVFANAGSAAGSGTLLDHYALASPVTVASPDTCILQVALSVAGS